MNSTFTFGDRQAGYMNSSAPSRYRQNYHRRNYARAPQICKNPALFKTTLCDYYVTGADCKFGEDCWYAHGEKDLRTSCENEQYFAAQQMATHYRKPIQPIQKPRESQCKTLLPLRENLVSEPHQEKGIPPASFKAEYAEDTVIFMPIKCRSIHQAGVIAQGLEKEMAAWQSYMATQYLKSFQAEEGMTEVEKSSRRTSAQFSATFSSSSESGLFSPAYPFNQSFNL
ncbi:unnamed protein product, partial [Mesorhabditis belari]|uniref:C3H1-type domain-containing protein n=1 Tax=Mesorhabditis belari TaxID=2138241 RepID=A0AAF3FAI3_9BILA